MKDKYCFACILIDFTFTAFILFNSAVNFFGFEPVVADVTESIVVVLDIDSETLN